MVKIDVARVVAAADTNEQGEVVFNVLLGELQRGTVILSFEGIKTATTSFVNSGFVPLLDSLSIEDIKQNLRIVESTKQINDLIRARLFRVSSGTMVA